VFKQIPAIEDRRLGQFLTGDSVKNSPALTSVLGMDDFLSLFNQKRPKILRNKINEKLLNAFKNRNWIKNFTVDETDSNYFRAYGRKIQGVSEHENVS